MLLSPAVKKGQKMTEEQSSYGLNLREKRVRKLIEQCLIDLDRARSNLDRAIELAGKSKKGPGRPRKIKDE